MAALHSAASTAATRFFIEKMQNDPEFVGAIEQLYADAVAKFLNQPTREKLVERMSERLSSAFDRSY